MKIVCVIPARYESSRFRGKPLADICGKPMIWWVYNNAKNVKDFDEVYVATDDDRIVNTCNDLGMEVIKTSDEHMTGTDRVGEVARRIPADLYVNIQGDEPMLKPETILEAIKPFYEDTSLQVSNLMTKISDPVEVVNPTVPKVITNKENIGIYLTRSASPYPKNASSFFYYKQICVYGFSGQALNFFCNTPRGKIESIEDIEILRFIENGYKVQFIEVDSDTMAVDTPKDLEKVRMIMQSKSCKEI